MSHSIHYEKKTFQNNHISQFSELNVQNGGFGLIKQFNFIRNDKTSSVTSQGSNIINSFSFVYKL